MSGGARRRTDRVLAPVRIRVTGKDASGAGFVEETVSVSFNQQGARISLTHTLRPDDVILIENLESGIEAGFRVLHSFAEVFGDRREWGVEALDLESPIWGIEFWNFPEGVRPKVLIECAGCKKAVQSTLSGIEYDVLLSTGLISRHCERCGETTRWKPSDQHLQPKGGAANQMVAGASGPQRGARRLQLAMCLRVRTGRGAPETSQTRDVSKSGLCLFTSNSYRVGEEVYVTLPYADQRAPVETRGRIVWAATAPGGRYVGVKYENE